MLPERVTPLLTLGKDLSGIQLQMSIAEGNKNARGYVNYRCLITKKNNSFISIRINRYYH